MYLLSVLHKTVDKVHSLVDCLCDRWVCKGAKRWKDTYVIRANYVPWLANKKKIAINIFGNWLTRKISLKSVANNKKRFLIFVHYLNHVTKNFNKLYDGYCDFWEIYKIYK